VAPQIGDGFGTGTPQMRPIWNPGRTRRARVKASIRHVTLFDNIFQGIFTKKLFELSCGRPQKHLSRGRRVTICAGLQLYRSEKAPLLRKAQKWATPEKPCNIGRDYLPRIQLARPVNLFELRVKQFDRIFRIFFFYQPGMLIVITSGSQKKLERTPPGEITKAEQLRKLWIKHRNHYTGTVNEREAILKKLGQ
jgi:Gp49-like protein DUF891